MDLNMYFLVFVVVLSSCSAFNFETRLPVIKRGSIGSYFGFSVAEHQSWDEVRNEVINSSLLVGAPLDQNEQPGTNHSGALWMCPITTYHNDCEQVITDGRRCADGHYEAQCSSSPDSNRLTPPLNDEVKDGQWLGVTVRSGGKGGKVMVCAHRYIRKGPDFMFGKGLCYTLSQMLDYDNTWEPCKGRPDNSGHEEFGFCQSGTSGAVINDTALIGSPGPYTWRGSIFMFNISDDFLDRDKTIYHSPHFENSSPVAKDSYLGMSVAAADFFGTGSLAYATGAPRSNGTGEVLIFVKDRPAVPAMKEKLRLTGDLFTSNFGYELITADVNGDKLPDLIVGAPNYFDKDVGGAVYIYVNQREDCSLLCLPPIKLTGPTESRFGIALANLGDINKDGYEDIAVGAPYEKNGVVYVYLGSKNGTVREPSQIIRGEEFGVETFGYSLSGGLDLDKNGYPDLLAGAFESEAVVFLRARPIIEITSRVGPSEALRRIDPNTPGCSKFPTANLTCFTFEACITVQGVIRHRKLDSEDLKLNYTLLIDTGRRVPRVFIGGHKDSFTSRPSMTHNIIGLKRETLTGELKHCHFHTLFLKEEIKDIQTAIAMRLSYKLVQKDPELPRPGDPLPSMDNFPILNQVQADKVFYATFLKDCGDNDICESQLSVDASLNLPTSRTSKKYDFILGEYKEILLNITVHNLNESAYESYLVIKHSSSLSYVAQVKVSRQICGTISETQVECELGNPLARNEGVNITLRFEPRSSIEKDLEVKFELIANTTSEQLDPQGAVTLTAFVIRKANLTMKASVRPEELLYGGEVRGESAIKYKEQLGTVVRHTYQVVNNGPSPVSFLEIIVSWPFQVANNKPLGKWLLYMDEEPTVDAEEGGYCDVEPKYVNPLGLRDKKTEKVYNADYNSSMAQYLRRRRRDVEMVVRKGPDNVVRMNCTEGTAKCFRFKCVIYKLFNQQSASITIRSRLWNSTLVEDYPKVKAVEIASHALIHDSPRSGIIITSRLSDQAANAISIAKSAGILDQQAGGGVEIWMIVVAVLLGLLLVLLVALCLWKCGFFKRTRPDPTLSGNLEKHTVDDYHDY